MRRLLDFIEHRHVNAATIRAARPIDGELLVIVTMPERRLEKRGSLKRLTLIERLKDVKAVLRSTCRRDLTPQPRHVRNAVRVESGLNVAEKRTIPRRQRRAFPVVAAIIRSECFHGNAVRAEHHGTANKRSWIARRYGNRRFRVR